MEKISFSNSQNYIVHCQTKLKKIERCLQLEQKKENKNPQPPNPNRQWYKGDRLHPTRKTRISFQNINKSHLSGSVFNINSHRMMHAAATQAQNISKPVQYKTQRLHHTNINLKRKRKALHPLIEKRNISQKNCFKSSRTRVRTQFPLNDLERAKKVARKSVKNKRKQREKHKNQVKEYKKQVEKLAKEKETLEEQMQQKSDEGLCSVCIDKKKTSVLIPCGHCTCCYECAATIQKSNGTCPVCRSRIEKIVKLIIC